jgi:dynein heavy chain
LKIKNGKRQVPILFLTYKGECNYGGRVTDEWDRRTLNTILARYYHKDVITSDNDDFKCFFDSSETYYVPQVKDHSQFLDYVRSLPMIAEPSVFGLADNADIIKDQQETNLMLSSILLTQVCKSSIK